MMLVIFIAMFLALAFGRRGMAMTCLFACLPASIGPFLWEIHSRTCILARPGPELRG